MPVKIYIPMPFRTFTGGLAEVQAEGKTVAEIIEELESRYPGLKDKILEPSGHIRHHVIVFLNEEDIRYLEGLQTPVTEKDTLTILPSIAGGSENNKKAGLIC